MVDPTFYRSAQAAAAAPPERLAYVATLNTPGPDGEAQPDAIVVLDTDPQSPSYGKIVGRVDMTHTGDELGIVPDPDFFVPFEGERPNQVRLEGGDASSDSYCYSS